MSKTVVKYALRTNTGGNTASGYFNQSFDTLDILSHEIRRFITQDALGHRYRNKPTTDHNEYVEYIRKYFRNTKIVKIKTEKSRYGLSQQHHSEKLRQTIIETMVDYYIVVMLVETLDSGMSKCSSTIYSTMTWNRSTNDKTVVFELLAQNYKENNTLISDKRQYFIGHYSPTMFSHRQGIAEQITEIRKFLDENKIKHKKATSARLAELYWLKKQSDLNYAKLFYNENQRIIQGDLTPLYSALSHLSLDKNRLERLMNFINKNHFTPGREHEEMWMEIDGIRVTPYQKLLFLP